MIKEKLRKKRIPARLVAIVVMTIGFVFVSSGLLSQSDSSTVVVIDNELPQSVRGNGRTLESDKPLPTPVANVEMDFVAVAKETGTDKVQGYSVLPGCLENRDKCTRAYTEREACRPWGHFYDTIYQRHLGKYSRADSEPMQFLEIGYFKGNGFEAYTNFLKPNKQAELHSMEISCLEPGPREEGKWPWGNFGEKHPMYRGLLESQRLHCGDASDYDFLYQTWTQYMKRPDAPPLKVVVDDGSHLAKHMAASLFFWLPRIEPGGMLVIEDIQPISEANQFRTHILPQVSTTSALILYFDLPNEADHYQDLTVFECVVLSLSLSFSFKYYTGHEGFALVWYRSRVQGKSP